MIDSDFIIKYTDALYSTPVEYAPSYDEFRDMFSSGQIKSKEWLVKELRQFSAAFDSGSAIVVGAWYGTLGMLLKKAYPKIKVTMLDIDPRCEKFIQNLIYDNEDLKCVIADMYEHHYKETLIVNTSCEHIPDLAEWVNVIPGGKLVALQSNNYLEGKGHINCVDSEGQLASESGLRDIWYTGKLEMPMYTRYMVIGQT
jgi:hypothetical protein